MKRALLIGIDYVGSQYELHGCRNDVKLMRDVLMRYWGYRSADITLLTEDSGDASHDRLET